MFRAIVLLSTLRNDVYFQFCYLYTLGADSSTPHQFVRGVIVTISLATALEFYRLIR